MDSEEKIKIEIFQNSHGKYPYERWFESLQVDVRIEVTKRLNRVRQALWGDREHLGGGIHELRFFISGGLRIYYGVISGELKITLLCGGNKDSQKRDIEKAREYWKEYKAISEERHEYEDA